MCKKQWTNKFLKGAIGALRVNKVGGASDKGDAQARNKWSAQLFAFLMCEHQHAGKNIARENRSYGKMAPPERRDDVPLLLPPALWGTEWVHDLWNFHTHQLGIGMEVKCVARPRFLRSNRLLACTFYTINCVNVTALTWLFDM